MTQEFNDQNQSYYISISEHLMFDWSVGRNSCLTGYGPEAHTGLHNYVDNAHSALKNQ